MVFFLYASQLRVSGFSSSREEIACSPHACMCVCVCVFSPSNFLSHSLDRHVRFFESEIFKWSFIYMHPIWLTGDQSGVYHTSHMALRRTTENGWIILCHNQCGNITNSSFYGLVLPLIDDPKVVVHLARSIKTFLSTIKITLISV